MKICGKCGIATDKLIQSKDLENTLVCDDCSIKEDLARHGLNDEQQEKYLETIHHIKDCIAKMKKG